MSRTAQLRTQDEIRAQTGAPLVSHDVLRDAERDIGIDLDVRGHCNGRLLHSWEANLERRFGARAPAHVRDVLGPLADTLPAAPRSRDWIPVATQLALTETIIEAFHGGDAEAFYPTVLEDTRKMLPRGARFVLRRLGVRRVLGKAPGLHGRLYDVGACRVSFDSPRSRWGRHPTHERRRATLHFRNAALFGHPTWRMLQRFATRMLFDLLGRELVALEGRGSSPDAFDLHIGWRG